MFNAELFRQMIDMLPLYVGESVFSCLYVAKFLSARFETKPLLILWLAPSVALDELLFALVPNTDPWHDSIWIAARIFLLVLLQKALFAHRDDVRIAAMQDAHITQLSAEIIDLTEIYSDLRSLRHDMNNHIENLSALFISSSSASEIQDYLDRMRDTADRLSLSYSTGNPVCDIIIHRKKTAAVSMGLSFECDLTFPDDSMLDAYDVGVILDNALDNALEATPHRNNDNLHGFIHIRSYQRSRLYFIEVKNPFSGEIEIDPKTYLPKSIKHDPSNHGLGLTTIRRIAEKYHGSAQCDISCLEGANIFTLTVMLRSK